MGVWEIDRSTHGKHDASAASPLRGRVDRCPLPVTGICFSLLLLALAPASHAQPTNAAQYTEIALACLGEVPSGTVAFRLDADAQRPYLRTALVGRWHAADYQPYLADTAQAPPDLPLLRYRVEQAQVTYERAGRKHLRRTVALALRYTWLGPDGQIRQDDACTDTRTDTLPRSAVAAIEDPAFPETQGAVPSGSFLRRYLEPALVVTVTAIGAYLFFTLRSDRADG